LWHEDNGDEDSEEEDREIGVDYAEAYQIRTPAQSHD